MSALDPGQLLEQAKQLAKLGRRRPTQANLRRAVSAAYYATFHLLIRNATHFLARGDRRLRLLLARAFVHEDMAQTCRTFASRGPLPPIVNQLYPSPLVVPPALIDVAQAFIDLQKARHDADYATHVRWTRKMVQVEIARAELAFNQWEKVRLRPKSATSPAPTPATVEVVRLFLSLLVFQKKLQGR